MSGPAPVEPTGVSGAERLPGLRVDWPEPCATSAFFTERSGGASTGPWSGPDGTGGLNLGRHCGDADDAVTANRSLVETAIGRPVLWLAQVHGCTVVDADRTGDREPSPTADASFTTREDLALAILVADCLPVLVSDRRSSIVGAAHAGWRGLSAGVVEALVVAMRARAPDAELVAWLGPRIGPQAFEVGDEVRAAFVARESGLVDHFVRGERPGKWLCDLGGIAARELARLGVPAVHDTRRCTVAESRAFWSYRREPRCGRMAAVIARAV